MGIEAGGNEYELRPVLFQRRQPIVTHRRAKFGAAAARRQRNVDHFPIVVVYTTVRIQRMLECRHHQDTMIAGKNFLGAVAVVHIEIGDRDARQSMRGESVRCADRDVVEQAKAHRSRPLGVVSGRAHRAKCSVAPSRHHEVDGFDDGTRSMKCRFERMRIERRVGIDKMQAGFGAGSHDLVDIALAMNARDLLARRFRRRVVLQITVDSGSDQAIADRSEAIRALRMVRAHIVQATRRMRDVRDGHGNDEMSLK